MTVALAVAVALVVLVGTGACSDDDGSGSDATVPRSAVPTSTTSTTVPAVAPTTVTPPPVSSVPTTVATGEVTIRGTVLTLFASARVLQIDPPVNGYSRIALTEETEYRTASGGAASLQDVEEGSTVEVSGEPGAPGTLIARLVVVSSG